MQMKMRHLLLLVLLAACHKDESAHMKRAKELMSVAEWANARTELKLEVKDHPQDVEARGLLLFCLDRTDGLDKSFGLLDLYTVLAASTGPDWDRTPQDMRDLVTKFLVSTRQSLYDKGVDTKDSADLSQVIVGAARFGFEKDDDKERRDSFAAILANSGDAAALQHLIDRLKSQNPEKVVDYIAAVGQPAVALLQKAIADHGFIGRAAALSALARIQGEAAARAFVVDNKDLRKPSGQDPAIPGSDSLGANFVGGRWDWSPVRVHGQYASTDGPIDGVLLLQSWNAASKTVVAGAFAFRDGEMKRLRATTPDGKPLELGGAAVVFGLRAEPSVLKFHRLQVRTVDREVETGRVDAPTVGMKVKLRGYTPHGQIVRRDDGGLWVVRVERPIEGMNELTVANSALVGLRTDQVRRTADELVLAKVNGDALQVTSVESGSDIAAMRDEICRCKDSGCIDRVTKKWAKAADASSAKEPTADDMQAAKEMTECMQAIMSGGRSVAREGD